MVELMWALIGVGVGIPLMWCVRLQRRLDDQYDLILTLEHSVRAHGDRLQELESDIVPTAPEPVEMNLRQGRVNTQYEPMVALKVVGPDGEELPNG